MLTSRSSAPVPAAAITPCFSRSLIGRRPGCVAIELAYNPPESGFMVAARQAGARAENGLGMLLYQAALAFERWTGQSPPIDVLEAALRSRVAA